MLRKSQILSYTNELLFALDFLQYNTGLSLVLFYWKCIQLFSDEIAVEPDYEKS